MNLTKQIETYLYSKKILIRDTIMVLIPISIAIAYLIVVVIMGIDLAPGSDYLKSVFMNFLGPLVLIGIGGLVYQVALITDAIRFTQVNVITKILICLCAWYLWPIVYIAKIIVYCARPRKNEET
jgi:arginine exporter protein ArgO